MNVATPQSGKVYRNTDQINCICFVPIAYISWSVFIFRCEVFRAMFATSELETEGANTLVLSDVNPDVFLALLEFIYTNCCSISTDMVSRAVPVPSYNV